MWIASALNSAPDTARDATPIWSLSRIMCLLIGKACVGIDCRPLLEFCRLKSQSCVLWLPNFQARDALIFTDSALSRTEKHRPPLLATMPIAS